METRTGETMSAAIYRLLLRLYPAEFRRRWEEEMVEVFMLQLADSRVDAWRCTLAELPLTSREGLAVPIVSLASSGAIFLGLMWALENGAQLTSVCDRLVTKLGG
jgi:hypothetical protein